MNWMLSSYGPYGRKNLIEVDENLREVWAEIPEAPSFVLFCPPLLFTLCEREKDSAVSVWERTENGFVLRDTCAFRGTCLCHLSFSPRHRRLFGACWGSGHLVSVRLGKDLRFSEPHERFEANETGDGSLRSRVHFSAPIYGEKTLAVNNVETDTVRFYEILPDGLKETDRILTPKGTHPRHSAFNADETRMYLITEQSNEILVYSLPDKTLLQRISTLPAGYRGESYGSAVALSPDGKTLYAANRICDTVAIFRVEENGLLSAPEQYPCHGKKPRHFALSPDGRTLAVCYQTSGTVVFADLDERGRPTGTYRSLPLPEASGVCSL